MGSRKRPRCVGVDLSDDVADKWFQQSLCLGDVEKDSFWEYKKMGYNDHADWEGLEKNNNNLMDLVIHTQGKLLKLKKFETQLKSFCDKRWPGRYNIDDISKMAARPRRMLSHLWQIKRGGKSIPKKYPT